MIVCTKILDKILNKFGIAGITLFPFILLKSDFKKNKPTINHEQIHIEQQKELLMIVFFIWYVLAWAYKLLIKKFSADKAYYRIIFEREAYSETNNLKYLKNRQKYNFLKY